MTDYNPHDLSDWEPPSTHPTINWFKTLVILGVVLSSIGIWTCIVIFFWRVL